MRTIQERLDEIVPKITDHSFMQGKGLRKEVGYHIFDYDSEDEMTARKHILVIKKDMAENYQHLSVVEFNLLDAVLTILEDKGYLEKNFTLEQRRGSQFVLNATRKSLRLTLENDLVVEHIKEGSKD